MLEPDFDEAQKFLRLLDPSAEQFTFQCWDDTEEERMLKGGMMRHGSLEEHFDWARRANQDRFGVGVAINETDLQGRKKENVLRVRAVFADVDGYKGGLLDKVKAVLPPSFVVQSSTISFHVYWRVDGLPLEEFSAVQAAIASRWGLDEVKGLPFPMRLPGFYHQKKVGQFLVKVIEP